MNTTTTTTDKNTNNVQSTSGQRLLDALQGDHKTRIKLAFGLSSQSKCTSEECDKYVDRIQVEQDAIRDELAAEAAKVAAAKSSPKMAPISNATFMAKAEAQDVMLGDKLFSLKPKQYSTGSVGFFDNGKVYIQVGGNLVQFQAQIQLTMIGSKPSTPAK